MSSLECEHNSHEPEEWRDVKIKPTANSCFILQKFDQWQEKLKPDFQQLLDSLKHVTYQTEVAHFVLSLGFPLLFQALTFYAAYFK